MEPQDVTRLLQRMGSGDEQAQDELHSLLYDELRERAHGLMGSAGEQHTLQATAVVHEAWLKVARGSGVEFQNRAHFLGVACRAMRMVLVDHARARSALKRGGGGGEREFLDSVILPYEESSYGLVELGDALEGLSLLDPSLAQIVDLRFFGGLTIEDTAKTLDTSPSSVERGWRTARAWLRTKLSADGTTDA